ncbi:MAG: zinc ribbon domain-containing protein [Calditrichaeota bacterium]|nr:MAG: zinc ribbon domain-containing protein [Calditrichota bacterium]
MPIYEYRCKKCQSIFEVLQRLNDQSEVNCPKCGTVEVEKQFSLFASSNSSSRDLSQTSCSSSSRFT